MENIIKRYKNTWYLTQDDIAILKKEWVINWIGWEWAPLKPIIYAILDLPYFDTDKWHKLLQDIEEYPVAYHDFDYYIWWNYRDFTKSNLKFASRIWKLTKRTSTRQRIGIFLLAFFITQIGWKKYWAWF